MRAKQAGHLQARAEPDEKPCTFAEPPALSMSASMLSFSRPTAYGAVSISRRGPGGRKRTP